MSFGVGFDADSLVTVRPAISPAAARSTATKGTAVDTLLANGRHTKSVVFYIATGVVTDGTYTVKVQESDTTTDGDFADVVANRQFNNPGTIQTTDDDKGFHISCRPNKRYVRLVVTPTGATTGAIYSAVAVLGEF